MNCRKFKSEHVGFVDDCLSAADMADMRQHLVHCASCATLDTRIRRSLLVVRNLPPIQPSPDFFARLTESLQHAPAPVVRRPTYAAAATFAAVTAALAAAVYLVMAFSTDRAPLLPAPASASATTAVAPTVTPPMNDVAIAAAVPAGIPVWPAMFMVGELPTHVANAELLDNTLGR